MTLRMILKHPDPRLKKVADPVDAPTPELAALAADLLQTMYDAPGIGLAAPQVGVPKRLIVMDCEKGDDAVPRPMVLLNPVVIWTSEARSTYEEGCLSIPDQYGDVERPAEVVVQWLALDGSAQEEHFTGLWATCVQHEIDHLEGKLFIDYLKPMRRQMITRRMEKLRRESTRA